MTNHGGERKGAGRPKFCHPAIRKMITLSPNIFEMLEKQRGNIPRSTYIQQLIRVADVRKVISKLS